MEKKPVSETDPEHYQRHKIEPIEVTEDWLLPYHLGNVVKYIARFQDHFNITDLKKARWYLDRFIKIKGGSDAGSKDE